MGVRNIKKQLAGVEDLLLGNGTQVQERNSGNVTVTKIDIPAVVDTVDDLAGIDTTKYRTAIVRDENRGGTFNYDSEAGVDNGGTIFSKWIRQYSGAVNVKWFNNSIKNALLTFAGDNNGLGIDEVEIDLGNQNIIIYEDTYIPVNVTLLNGTISGAFKVIYYNPAIIGGTHSYTEYWAYMASKNYNINYLSEVVISCYIKGAFTECTFHGVTMVNSNGIWTEYTVFDRCRFSGNATLGYAILMDGNTGGLSTHSIGTGAGTDSFGYTTFSNCIIDSTQPTVGLKIEGGGVLYNSNLDLKGYARGGVGAVFYIVSGGIRQSNFNVGIETFGSASNIISLEAGSTLWYNYGNIRSASPEAIFADNGADLRLNNIYVTGAVLQNALGSAIYQGDQKRSFIVGDVNKREYARYLSNIVRATHTAQTISSNVRTKVLLATEVIDTRSTFNASRLLPTVEGYYKIEANIKLSTSVNVLANAMYIYKNGAEYSSTVVSATLEDAYMSISDIVYLNGTTDYIEIYAYSFDNAASPVITTARFTSNYISQY